MGQSPLDTIRKRLCRMIEFNADILYKNDSAVMVGWVIVREKEDGGTAYKIICQDTSRERKFNMHNKFATAIPWEQVATGTGKKKMIIQPFAVGGSASGYLEDYQDVQAEARMKDWLASLPAADTTLLRPFTVTITGVISCSLSGSFPVSPIPKSAIPKPTMPVGKKAKVENP